MCDEPFLCADATELLNHPALRRALKLRDACRICWEPRLFCIGGLLSGYHRFNICILEYGGMEQLAALPFCTSTL